MTQQNQLVIWGVAAGAAACVLLPLLDHMGRIELAVPIGAAAGTIGAVIKVNWELHRHAWFWVTMGIITSLHALLILNLPWHKGWIAAPVTLSFCMVDLMIILGILSLLTRLFRSGTKSPM